VTRDNKARAVGINHVALEVGDIDEALAFYGRFLDFTLRSKGETMAVIDLGDQFIALSEVPEQQRDRKRHFGLVVDDKDAVRQAIEEMGVEVVSERFLDFMDPWGNRVEVVGYDNIQFTKAPHVLRGMGLKDLQKNENALAQLADKGMNPP
jgi:catechol 2,3-dioxygenase-like lactoylglutathione lyase family enzyme